MRSLIPAFALVGALSLTITAFAEEPAPATPEEVQESPAEERAAQFVGVTGPDAESVPGGALMLAAYAVVWVLLFFFLMRIRNLQRQTAEELERLSAKVSAIEGS